MESIIIWIVIIVAGYVFEQLKKRAEQKKAEEEALDRHSHMAKSRSNAPASHPRETDRPIHRPAPAMVAKPAPFREKPQPAKQHSTSPLPNRSATTVQAYKPLDIPADEAPMEVIEHIEEPERQTHASSQNADRSLSAHYARWRQAILDTQVLERKF